MPLGLHFLQGGDHYLAAALTTAHSIRPSSWVSTYTKCRTTCHFVLIVCPLRTVILSDLCLPWIYCKESPGWWATWRLPFWGCKPLDANLHYRKGPGFRFIFLLFLRLNLHVYHLFSCKKPEVLLSLRGFLTWSSRCGSFVVRALWWFHGVTT